MKGKIQVLGRTMRHPVAILLALAVLVLVFVAGFFTANAFMRWYVGHENETEVPDLEGTHIDKAKKAARENNLYILESERVFHDSIPKNHVVKQTPDKGIRTKIHRTIHVTVSDGPELVSVPYLEGLTLDEANTRLSNAGLSMGQRDYWRSTDVARGKIIRSMPPAQSLVARQSRIDVIISQGSTQFQDRKEWESWLDDVDLGD